MDETIRVVVELKPHAGWARLTRGDAVVEVRAGPAGGDYHVVEGDWQGKYKSCFAHAFLQAWEHMVTDDEKPPLWMDLY